MSDKAAKLSEFKELLDSGVLSQAEFDAEKAKILAGSDSAAPAAPLPLPLPLKLWFACHPAPFRAPPIPRRQAPPPRSGTVRIPK